MRDKKCGWDGEGVSFHYLQQTKQVPKGNLTIDDILSKKREK